MSLTEQCRLENVVGIHHIFFLRQWGYVQSITVGLLGSLCLTSEITCCFYFILVSNTLELLDIPVISDIHLCYLQQISLKSFGTQSMHMFGSVTYFPEFDLFSTVFGILKRIKPSTGIGSNCSKIFFLGVKIYAQKDQSKSE